MRTLANSLLLAATLGAASAASAGVIHTLSASEDTFITQHADLGGAGSVHGDNPLLTEIGAINPTWMATPLVKFDLSVFTGVQVVGDATFSMYLYWGWEDTTTEVGVYESLSQWSEATTTWLNIEGGAPYGLMGALLDSTLVSITEMGQGYVSWNIAGSVIQNWIDNPFSNNGVLLTTFSNVLHSDVAFMSRETAYGPQLSFATVPEPGTGLLLMLGLFGLQRRQRTVR